MCRSTIRTDLWLTQTRTLMNSDRYVRLYWNEVTSLRGHVIYIRRYRGSAKSNQRRLDVLLAGASSTSLAVWVVAQNLAWLWALFIALAQVVFSLRQFLPFQRRERELDTLHRRLSDVALYAERKWFRVYEGDLTAGDIFDLIMEVRERRDSEVKGYLQQPLPERSDLREAAEVEAKEYFLRSFYPDENGPTDSRPAANDQS